MNIYIFGNDFIDVRQYLQNVYTHANIEFVNKCDNCTVFDLIIVYKTCDIDLLTYITQFKCAKYAIDLSINSDLMNQFQKKFSLHDICITNAEQYFTMKPKLLIVGNSTYLIDKNYGSFIDKFDNIVRINRFNIEKDYNDIGSKVTHILLNHPEVSLGSNFSKYYNLPLFVNWNSQSLNITNPVKRKRNKNTHKLLKKKSFTCITLNNCIRKKYFFSGKGGDKPSIGMQLILHLLERQPNDYDIFIINFCYDNCKLNINNTPNNPTHNLIKEKNIFEKLSSEYKITFLK